MCAVRQLVWIRSSAASSGRFQLQTCFVPCRTAAFALANFSATSDESVHKQLVGLEEIPDTAKELQNMYALKVPLLKTAALV